MSYPRRFLCVLLVLLAAWTLSGLAACRLAREQQDQPVVIGAAGDTNFTNVVTSGYVDAGSYVDADTYLKAGSYVDAGSYVEANTYVAASTYLNAGTYQRFTKRPRITVLNQHPITPTGSFQPITATGTTSHTMIANGTAGDILVLLNESPFTITLSDTGTLKLSGHAELGQYDSITLMYDTANWVELARTDS